MTAAAVLAATGVVVAEAGMVMAPAALVAVWGSSASSSSWWFKAGAKTTVGHERLGVRWQPLEKCC